MTREIPQAERVCLAPRCGNPAETGLCLACRARLRRKLAETESLIVALSARLERWPQQGGQRVRGTREPPAPLRLDVLSATMRDNEAVHGAPDDLDTHPNLPGVLHSWARLILDERPRLRRSSLDTLSRVLDVLHRNLDWLCDQPFADEAYDDLMSAYRHAERLAGVQPLVHRLAAPCPACDHAALRRDDGDSRVRCAHCHAVWTETEYDRLVLVLADEARRRA